MSKYISKDDAILAIAQHEMYEAEEYPYASKDIEDWKEVGEMMLANVPNADVVEVVRCKDCKNRDHSCCFYSALWVKMDGYCNYGERIEISVEEI